MAETSVNDIIKMMEDWFAKAPALPENAKEVIVKITPIIAIVFGILGVLFSVSGMGVLTFLSPIAAMGVGTGFIGALFWFVASILMIASFPGTKARKISGWKMLFWSETINLAGSLASFSVLSGIIGALIGFYLLFQIKSFYK